MPNLRGWELLIILAIVLLLFGSKKLPDAARGLGRSLRIFKSETKGLMDDDKAEPGADAAAAQPTVTAAPPAAALPEAPAAPATPPVAPTQAQAQAQAPSPGQTTS
jgi:sec-independent protein translocase protein TatA